MPVLLVVSGGQTGVDRAALDAALAADVAYGGWCPAGGWAEDLVDPPGLLTAYPRLQPTPGTDARVRTRWNVRDSTAVLVLHLGGLPSPGTLLTVQVAAELGRPCLVADAEHPASVRRWVATLPAGAVLDVAGPRESEQPGVYAAARRTLEAVLTAEGSS